MAKESFCNFFKYNSITTPNFEHSAYCLAAEIMVVRHSCENGYNILPYFWRKDVPCEEKYVYEYNKNIQCMRKLMKTVPPHFVIQCIVYAKQIKHADYGYIVATIKSKWEKWNKNMANRVNNIIKEQSIRDVAIEELLEMSSSTNDNFEYIETKGRKKRVKI